MWRCPVVESGEDYKIYKTTTRSLSSGDKRKNLRHLESFISMVLVIAPIRHYRISDTSHLVAAL